MVSTKKKRRRGTIIEALHSLSLRTKGWPPHGSVRVWFGSIVAWQRITYPVSHRTIAIVIAMSTPIPKFDLKNVPYLDRADFKLVHTDRNQEDGEAVNLDNCYQRMKRLDEYRSRRGHVLVLESMNGNALILIQFIDASYSKVISQRVAQIANPGDERKTTTTSLFFTRGPGPWRVKVTNLTTELRFKMEIHRINAWPDEPSTGTSRIIHPSGLESHSREFLSTDGITTLAQFHSITHTLQTRGGDETPGDMAVRMDVAPEYGSFDDIAFGAQWKQVDNFQVLHMDHRAFLQKRDRVVANMMAAFEAADGPMARDLTALLKRESRRSESSSSSSSCPPPPESDSNGASKSKTSSSSSSSAVKAEDEILKAKSNDPTLYNFQKCTPSLFLWLCKPGSLKHWEASKSKSKGHGHKKQKKKKTNKTKRHGHKKQTQKETSSPSPPDSSSSGAAAAKADAP